MKRNITCAIMIAITITTNVLCENTMQIKVKNTSIDVPSGWMAQYTDSVNMFILYSPVEENDTFQENANLVIERLPTKYSVKGYLKATQDVLKGVYGNFELIESGEDYHIISGILNEIEIVQIQFVSINENTAYIMTYTSNPENFQRFLTIFINIQKTFRY